MALTAAIQPSLAAGEVSPLLWHRQDLAWHSSAARELENFVPTPQGPVVFAGGTRFVAEVGDSSVRHRLIPFRFSVDDSYMLIFGDATIRFGRNKGIIELSGAPVELDSGDGVPWQDTELGALRYAQSNDVLFLAHGSYPPRELRRASHTSWSIPLLEFVDGPFYAENTGATTFTVSSAAKTTGVTVTASAVTGINDDTGFQSTDVGRHIRMKFTGGEWGWSKITAYTSTTVVTVENMQAYAGGTVTTMWRMGLFSETTGWPSAVVIHGGRLWFASNVRWSLPRIDGSKIADFTNFGPDTTDDAAVAKTVGSGELTTILDLRSLRDLIVITAGKEFRAWSGTAGQQITPTSIEVLPVTAHGAAAATPGAEAYSAVLFVQRDARTVRRLTYAIDQDGYQALDLTVRAPHIGKSGPADADGGISALAFVQSPFNIMLAVRNDGVMPGLTFLPEQEVQAWMRHVRAPTAAGASAVESVAAIPYEGIDQPWVIVKRTIDGSEVRYIEILEQPLGDDDAIEDAFYVDSGLTLDNTGETESGSSGCTLTPGTGALAAETTGVTFTAGSAVFVSGDVGRRILYRFLDTVNYPPSGRHPRHKHLVWATASAVITGYTSTTVVTATIEAAFPALAAIAADAWRLTVSSIAGLDHLEGETVQVWADGSPQAEQVVSAGAIALETPAATVQAGLGYGGRLDPFIELRGARDGKKRKVIGIKLAFWRTVGGRVRVPPGEQGGAWPDTELVPYRTSGDETLAPIQPASGWTQTIPVPGDWEENPVLLIEQDIPGPMCIRAVRPVFQES